MAQDDTKELDLPSTSNYEKALDDVIELNTGITFCVSVGEWFKIVLEKIWGSLNDKLVFFLGSKFDATVIKKISNSIRDVIVTVVTAIITTIFGILENPAWWKFTMNACTKAFQAEDSYLKGALAFGQKFGTILLSTISKVITKVLKKHDMSLSEKENDELESLINGNIDASSLQIGNQQKQIKK